MPLENQSGVGLSSLAVRPLLQWRDFGPAPPRQKRLWRRLLGDYLGPEDLTTFIHQRHVEPTTIVAGLPVGYPGQRQQQGLQFAELRLAAASTMDAAGTSQPGEVGKATLAAQTQHKPWPQRGRLPYGILCHGSTPTVRQASRTASTTSLDAPNRLAALSRVSPAKVAKSLLRANR